MTDAADGGIADRGGGRGSYRVINFDAGKFCSGHIVRPVYLNRCPYRAREGERRQQQGSSCSTCAGRRCGAATLAGAGVSDLAKLLVVIQGDDGAWAVTDAADGGIADRGGGRGSYRVINFDAGKFCSGHIVRPVYLNRCPYARARGRAAATTGIELLDLRGPAVWCCDAGRRRRFRFSEIVGRDSRRRWSLGGDRRC